MPITPMPTTIELSDFSAGLVTEAEEVGVPPNALLSVENLILDPVTGTLQTRKGYKRVRELGAALDGYRLYAMHPYTTKVGNRYIIAVFSNDIEGAANNIRVHAYNLDTGDFTRIDTAGRVWASANGRHWGATVDGTYYGGPAGEKMYSWDGTTWVADPGTPSFPAWILAGNTPPPTANERKKDYAFKAGQSVTYLTEAFQAKKDIRYDKWDPDVEEYVKGDLVSTKYDLNGNGAYWRSWKCVKDHKPTEANKPMAGAALAARAAENKGLWKKVQLDAPLDEDSKLNAKHWNRVPDAPKTHIAIWHGNRLFARNDAGIGGKQTLLYSRQAKVADPDNDEKGTIGKAGDPQWDPDDWRTGGAPGAGFQPFETPQGDSITGLVSFGYYLLVFKRFSTWVIAGINPDTWTVRKLADVGTAYSKAHCEHDGLVYFLSDRGFFQTDGTEIRPVEGAAKMDKWLREVVDWDNEPKDIELWSFGGLVWMTLPTTAKEGNNRVMLFEPQTQSFWPQNIGGQGKADGGIQTACVARYKGNDHLFFSTVNQTGTVTFATYSWGGGGQAHANESYKILGGVTTINRLLNPTFQATNQWDKPNFWNKTTADKVVAKSTRSAARRGRLGLELSNTRKAGVQAGAYGGFEGVYATPTVTGAHVVQFYVRRRTWERNPEFVPKVQFLVDTIAWLPTGSEYVGEGWHKMWRDFTGTGVPQNIGLLTPPDTTVEVDQASVIAGSGAKDYFDGNGGEAAGNNLYTGSQRPYIMRYGHEEAKDANFNWTDDEQQVAYTAGHINWLARTAWLTFGAMMEERRIRRLWSLVRGTDITVGMRTFRNFNPKDEGSYVDSAGADQEVFYHEGTLPDDCHSIQLEVEGDRAPASFLAAALDTEPRRIRFGRR